MENNTLAVLVAVILMGFTAVAMIATADVTPRVGDPVKFDTPFPDQNASGLGKNYTSN